MEAMVGGGGIGLGLVLEQPALVHPPSLLPQAADQAQASGSSRGSERQLLLELKATPRSKSKSLAMSDEEDPSNVEDCGTEAKNKKGSPWQRMKWTDAMVKLLIGMVLLVGEDGCLEGLENNNKRKVGILQKKGKWKSVAQLMMDKGCYVSPQQCEDKFNDLNKRYKRLNDVLGKENAAAVSVNPSLVSSMEHLSPKAVDDARKILSSRHLFYKEMVAYHNGDTATLAVDLDFHIPRQNLAHKHREMMEAVRGKYENSEEEDEEVEEEDEMDDDYNEEDACQGQEMDVASREMPQVASLSLKRRKVQQQQVLQQLEDSDMAMAEAHTDDCHGKDPDVTNGVLMRMVHENFKTPRDHQQQWLKSRTMQLKEQKMGLQAEAFNLEKQRFKWQKTTCKKDREIERLRLENERMKLENERIALQLKQRELEMNSRRPEVSMTSIALLLEKLHATDKKETEDN